MIFAIAGVIIAIILIAIFSNPNARQCRWREDRRRGSEETSGREKTYVCAACGAQAVTTNVNPPFDCRRPDTNSRL